jgi:hypothetical protein
MNLNQLSEQNTGLMGVAVGFVIKSLAHPERKFMVEAKLGGGKYAITRLDTGASYFVLGTEDRYEFAITAARIREVKAEIGELTEQAGVIAARLLELNGELGVVAAG